MNWNQAKQAFLEESRELLWDMEDALLRIESGGGKEEVNAIFQAVHAIKESAESFGCAHVAPFAHAVENLVGKMRDYEIKPAGKLITSLFLCCDLLRGLVNHVAHNNSGNSDADIEGIFKYFKIVECFTSEEETTMFGGMVAAGKHSAGFRQAA